jgi:hypothetical protein
MDTESKNHGFRVEESNVDFRPRSVSANGKGLEVRDDVGRLGRS